MKTLTILASETGARLDSDVRRGGGSDDTRFLQQALDRAGEDQPLELVMDGAALVRGLRLHSNTTIRCLNRACGFYLADGANEPVVRNATYTTGEIVLKPSNIRQLSVNGISGYQGAADGGPRQDVIVVDGHVAALSIRGVDIFEEGPNEGAFLHLREGATVDRLLLDSCNLPEGKQLLAVAPGATVAKMQPALPESEK